MITFKVELEREDDGRWLAEVVELPGVLADGETQEAAPAAPMPDPVITRLEQVTPEWLTQVLTRNGALAQGAVAAFDVDTGRGNWSTNASLRVRYVEGAQAPDRVACS